MGRTRGARGPLRAFAPGFRSEPSLRSEGRARKSATREENTMARSEGLHRSEDRIIAGVCGGIADWLDWSPTSVRIL